MEHANTIKTGLIGYGFAGQTFHAPILAAVSALQLTAVSSSQPDRVHKDWPGVTVYADAAALIADPAIELVVIAAPNLVHFSLAHAALLAGKHVVVDKPFTITSAEAATLCETATQRGLVLSVYQNRRWDADFLTLRALLEEGTLGRIATVESHYDRFRPEVKQRWRESADEPGAGVLYDLGPHLIDQALQLFGPPQRLYADIAAQRDGSTVDDYFHLVLYYAKDMRVVLHAGCLVNAPTPRFVVHGDKGSFVKFGLDVQEDALKAGGRPGQPGWGKDPVAGTLHLAGSPDQPWPMLDGAYQRFYEGIAAAIRDKVAAPVSAADGLATMVLLEAAMLSAKEGRVVAL